MLPDYQDEEYYLHDKNDTLKGEDLESSQNGVKEPYQTQWKHEPPQTYRKLSGMCSYVKI